MAPARRAGAPDPAVEHRGRIAPVRGARPGGSGGLRATCERAGLALLLGCASLGFGTFAAAPALAAAGAGSTPATRTVVLAFVPAGERELAAAGLSVGVMSATQGGDGGDQMLLDITQGARVSLSAYPRGNGPGLALVSASSAGGHGFLVRQVVGWQRAVSRACAAPQSLTPGLLATSAGGAAYIGTGYGGPYFDAIVAADEQGSIAATSLGPEDTLLARISAALAAHRLVVADLPSTTILSRLVRARPPGELLLAVQRLPERSPRGELLWLGAAGLPGGDGRELSSASTTDRGLVSTIDIAPTALGWLGLHVPSEVRGRTIEARGLLGGGAAPRALMARLRVIGGRRLRAFGLLLAFWTALLLASVRRAPLRAAAMRVGALALLFSPLAAMITAALEPGAALEYALVIMLCFGLGALSDRLLAWPRALLAPGIAVAVAVTADALARTELLTRSLIGPDPILGARFYGIGNELKSGLAVLVLATVAAALTTLGHGREHANGRERSRGAAAAMACAGAVLAAIEGSARIGAGVGGVILVCAGFALAAALLLPGALSRRRALAVVLAPLAGLAALVVLDVLTAHGTGHFSGSILHARSAGDLRDILVRRYEAAFSELHNHAMPAATAVALAAAAIAVRNRDRLLAPVGGSAVWLAALAGGLTAGLVGTLVEDSGPLLLVVAAFALGCVLSYIWGRPPARSP